MKRALVLLCCLVFLCACSRSGASTEAVVSAPPTISQTRHLPENRTVRVCVTQMLADSSVMDALRARFEAQSDYRLDLAVNPNSVAVSVAQSGNADLLLVQSDTTTKQFIASGYGMSGTEWLHDSLVLAGPASDPAGVRECRSAAEAMAKIAGSGATFVSRYDDSDVCKIETALWSKAGVVIGNGRRWYKAARLEMVGTLHLADENKAYLLCEKETFLQNRGSVKLQILLEDAADLRTAYCIVPVSPELSDRINTDGAAAFAAFLQSAETAAYLASYGTEDYGQPVFETAAGKPLTDTAQLSAVSDTTNNLQEE